MSTRETVSSGGRQRPSYLPPDVVVALKNQKSRSSVGAAKMWVDAQLDDPSPQPSSPSPPASPRIPWDPSTLLERGRAQTHVNMSTAEETHGQRGHHGDGQGRIRAATSPQHVALIVEASSPAESLESIPISVIDSTGRDGGPLNFNAPAASSPRLSLSSKEQQRGNPRAKATPKRQNAKTTPSKPLAPPPNRPLPQPTPPKRNIKPVTGSKVSQVPKGSNRISQSRDSATKTPNKSPARGPRTHAHTDTTIRTRTPSPSAWDVSVIEREVEVSSSQRSRSRSETPDSHSDVIPLVLSHSPQRKRQIQAKAPNQTSASGRTHKRNTAEQQEQPRTVTRRPKGASKERVRSASRERIESVLKAEATEGPGASSFLDPYIPQISMPTDWAGSSMSSADDAVRRSHSESPERYNDWWGPSQSQLDEIAEQQKREELRARATVRPTVYERLYSSRKTTKVSPPETKASRLRRLSARKEIPQERRPFAGGKKPEVVDPPSVRNNSRNRSPPGPTRSSPRDSYARRSTSPRGSPRPVSARGNIRTPTRATDNRRPSTAHTVRRVSHQAPTTHRGSVPKHNADLARNRSPSGRDVSQRNRSPSGRDVSPRNRSPSNVPRRASPQRNRSPSNASYRYSSPSNRSPSGRDVSPRNRSPSGRDVSPRNRSPSGRDVSPRNRSPSGRDVSPRNRSPSNSNVPRRASPQRNRSPSSPRERDAPSPNQSRTRHTTRSRVNVFDRLSKTNSEESNTEQQEPDQPWVELNYVPETTSPVVPPISPPKRYNFAENYHKHVNKSLYPKYFQRKNNELRKDVRKLTIAEPEMETVSYEERWTSELRGDPCTEWLISCFLKKGSKECELKPFGLEITNRGWKFRFNRFEGTILVYRNWPYLKLYPGEALKCQVIHLPALTGDIELEVDAFNKKKRALNRVVRHTGEHMYPEEKLRVESITNYEQLEGCHNPRFHYLPNPHRYTFVELQENEVLLIRKITLKPLVQHSRKECTVYLGQEVNEEKLWLGLEASKQCIPMLHAEWSEAEMEKGWKKKEFTLNDKLFGPHNFLLYCVDGEAVLQGKITRRTARLVEKEKEVNVSLEM